MSTLGAIGNCGECKFSVTFKTQDGSVDFSKRSCKYEPPKLVTIPIGPNITIVSLLPTVDSAERGCHHFAPAQPN